MAKKRKPAGDGTPDAPLEVDITTQILAKPPEGATVFVKVSGTGGEWIHRKMIKKAEWNPRTITADAKKRLREEIELHGYVDRIVLNLRTGCTIVRGHQRLDCLDAIMRTKDYWLPITLVDESEEWEREANISGNSTAIQGEYDPAKLKDAIEKWNLKPEAIGFKAAELRNWFGISKTTTDLAALDAQIAAIEEFRESNEKLVAETDDENDPNFFLVLALDDQGDRKALMVFQTPADRAGFCEHVGVTVPARHHEAKSIRLRAVLAENDTEKAPGGDKSA